MIGIAALLAIIGITGVGLGALGLAGVDVPAIFGTILGVLIPFITFSFGFVLFSITHFWIVLGVIEIIIMGYSMGERDFMEMMRSFVALNIKVGLLFYDFIRRLFSLVISVVKVIPFIGGA